MWTQFENKVIEIYNKAANSENSKVQYEQNITKDDLGNISIHVQYSGVLRSVQEQICEIYNHIDKEKVLRATELLIRSFNYRNGPALTLPEKFEIYKLTEEINGGYKRKPIKIIPKIEIL